LQIILTDEDDKNVYEEEFEKWDEEMSSIAYMDNDSCDSIDEEETRKKKEKDDKKKYTPILNPDFNKPINNTTVVEKSLPALIPSPVSSVFSDQKEEEEEEEKVDMTDIITQEPEPIEQQQQQIPVQQQEPIPQKQKVVTGLKRLLSIGRKNSKEIVEDRGISSASLLQKQQVIDEENNKQFHVLRIFSGNINVGAMFNTVAVTPDMNADQLLKLALQKFHIPLLEENSHNRRPSSENGIEYYLTVKSMDGGKKSSYNRSI
jgi:ribosomal protein S13